MTAPAGYSEEKIDEEKADAIDEPTTEGIVRQLIQDAENYVDSDLVPARATATRFYNGAPLGNEEEGRSQVVSTDLRDAVQGILPDFARAFFGPERVIEFEPPRADQEAYAEQASSYVTHIYSEDNEGLLKVLGWLKDGVVKKMGIGKWWVERYEEAETQTLYGQTEMQIAMLEQEPNTSYEVIGESKMVVTLEGPQLVYDCKVTTHKDEACFKWDIVPPDEMIFNRDARGVAKSRIMCHRRTMTLGDAAKALTEAGHEISVEELKSYQGVDGKLPLNPEAQERNPSGGVFNSDNSSADPSMNDITIYEAYVRIDQDGDGFPEWRRFWAAGQGYHLFNKEGELWEGDPPFAFFCPDPEPHTLVGSSWYDYLREVQLIKTAVLRGNLDSLGLSLFPRTEVVEGQVNPHDILNTELGAIIRVKQPGMVREVKTEYVGAQSFPLLDYMDSVKEDRTGRTKAAAGLDPSTMQSSTRAAVAATVSAGAARVELLARIFAETALKPLFRGLFNLIRKHQDLPRMIRLNGKFTEIDPRPWEDMECRVVLALGAGMAEEKLAALQAIYGEQKEAYAAGGGPMNPLVSIDKMRYTLAKMTELAGYRNADKFWNPISAEEGQQMKQMAAQQPPPPDPAMEIAKAEVSKIQAEMQMKQAELQLKQSELQLKAQQSIMESELKKEQMAQDFQLKTRELELKYAADINELQMRRAIEGSKAALAAESEAHRVENDAALRLHQIQVKADVDRDANELKAAAAVETAKHKEKPSDA